jgi:hypothetical protein
MRSAGEDRVRFVGRSAEIASLRRELEAGRNVVIVGKYGIGRTSLVRQAAAQLEAAYRFYFLDFASTPAGMCRSAFEEIFKGTARRRRPSPESYRQVQRFVAHESPREARIPVLVFDDVARLTPAKCALLRYLARTGHFRFIAIAEAFLSSADLSRLRVLLFPNALLTLHPLAPGESEEFFSAASRNLGLSWTASRMSLLARVKHGYPLAMAETVARELRRRKERL